MDLKCERFIQSIKGTTREHAIELLFYIDNDDINEV